MSVDICQSGRRKYYIVERNTPLHALLTRFTAEGRRLETPGEIASKYAASSYIRKQDGSMGLNFIKRPDDFKHPNRFGFCTPKDAEVAADLARTSDLGAFGELNAFFFPGGLNLAQFTFTVEYSDKTKVTKLIEVGGMYGAPVADHQVLRDGTIVLYLPDAIATAHDVKKQYPNIELIEPLFPVYDERVFGLYGISSKMAKLLTDSNGIAHYNFTIVPQDSEVEGEFDQVIDLVEFPDFVFNRTVNVKNLASIEKIQELARSEMRKAFEFYVANDYAIPTPLPSQDPEKTIYIW